MTIGSYHVIAVADDNQAVRAALGRLLSAMGYQVQLFASGLEFLHAMTTSHAECFILDIDLGDTDGLTLARQLDAAGFKRPIVFMTASDDNWLQKKCLDVEGAAFLRKPFSGDELGRTIKMLLDDQDASNRVRQQSRCESID